VGGNPIFCGVGGGCGSTWLGGGLHIFFAWVFGFLGKHGGFMCALWCFIWVGFISSCTEEVRLPASLQPLSKTERSYALTKRGQATCSTPISTFDKGYVGVSEMKGKEKKYHKLGGSKKKNRWGRWGCTHEGGTVKGEKVDVCGKRSKLITMQRLYIPPKK